MISTTLGNSLGHKMRIQFYINPLKGCPFSGYKVHFQAKMGLYGLFIYTTEGYLLHFISTSKCIASIKYFANLLMGASLAFGSGIYDAL